MGVIKENKELLDKYLKTNDANYVDEILMNSVDIMFNAIKSVLDKYEIEESKAEEYFGGVYLDVREKLIEKKDSSASDFGFYCSFTNWVKRSVVNQIKKERELIDNVVFFDDLKEEKKELDNYFLTRYFEELSCKKLSEKDKRKIKKVFDELSENQKEIIYLHFGFGGNERMLLSDIAKKMNKTSEAVSLSLCNALRRFRKGLFNAGQKDNLSKKK